MICTCQPAFGAGQIGALIKDIKPIKEIIEEMVS
jgi:hypothetical protein